MSDWVVEANNLTRIYQMGKEIDVKALRGVSLNIERSEVVSIMGPSGSGKSTLMHILGCLDRPTSGEYCLGGEKVSTLSDDQLSSIRNRKVGFVFQSFNLLARQTALANVMLPLRYAGKNERESRQRSLAMLEMVGLGDRVNHKSNELSGGQQQRVAIARAMANDPTIILADEPTGALDSKSGQEILDLMLMMNRERGTTLILVTHDPRIGGMTQRTIRLKDGLIVEENV